LFTLLVVLVLSIEINDWRWIEYPSVDLAETFVLSVAAGQSDEDAAAAWLRSRIEPLA
jgi:hypothetical protein